MVELLVTVAIIGTLTAVLIPQLEQFKNYQSLADTATTLQTALRTAQSNASNGTKCSGGGKAAWWGVKISSNPSFYQLLSVCAVDPGITMPTPAASSTVTLPVSTTISSIFVNGCRNVELKGSPVTIEFTNVSGAISFTGSTVSGCPSQNHDKLIISLSDNATGAVSQVVVEKGSSIYVPSTPAPTPNS